MIDFWQVHDQTNGMWLLIGLLFFPRLTMLYAVATPFGWLYWLGWFFIPRYLGAWIATLMYWNINPTLVVMAWVAAFLISGGETGGVRRSS